VIKLNDAVVYIDILGDWSDPQRIVAISPSVVIVNHFSSYTRTIKKDECEVVGHYVKKWYGWKFIGREGES